MEMPLVVETLGLVQPVDRDPFLIGLAGPAPTTPASPEPRALIEPPNPRRNT
jgi:hypothetical protein